MPAARLGVLLLLLFGLTQTVSGQNVTTACTPTSLCLDNTYFVTGDYVVGGVGLRGLGVNGFATGSITIPDPMQPNSTSVPAGADIVAAFLYWETVEKAQSTFDGQNGFFNGYAITGTVLGNPNAPTSWSSGGCSGNSQGTTTMRAYRTDVRPYLPLDANGNIQPNSHYQVKLADSGSQGGGTPLALGATLIIVYRVLSPKMPLNAVLLYDGAAAPSNAGSTFSQPIVGFYQPATSPVAKITHIVGNGKSNKLERVALNSVNLPSLYGTLPPFPGIYNASWDNPTWSVSAAVSGADTQTTSVVPNSNNGGCVSWGAVIFSTTVQDTDGDGLLDVWEGPNQGYTDAKTGQFVALPGADPNVKDIFVEVDYLSNLDGLAGNYLHSHLPKQAALDMVGNAFKNAPVDCNPICQGVKVHFDMGPVYQSDPYVIKYPVPLPNPLPPGGKAISESALLCNDNGAPPLCQFPGSATIAWKGGFLFVRDSAAPLANFQPGRELSYHEVLFGHALGDPRSSWSAAAAALSIPGVAISQLVSIVNNAGTAKVTIQSPPGVLKPGDLAGQCPNFTIPACSDANLDRVTVAGALGQSALNGTYQYASVQSGAPGANNIITTTFNITTSLNVAAGTYKFSCGVNDASDVPPCAGEPQLGVAYAGPTSTSGHSDFRGGGDSAVMFGSWGADDPLPPSPTCQGDPSQPLQAGQAYCNNELGSLLQQAGTLMHEVGHSLTLTHGGTYYDDPNNPSVPTYDLNCKPNVLSVMNYLFQVRGFADNQGIVDYSGQTLPNLSESELSETLGIGLDLFTNQPAAHLTRWYAPPNAVDITVGRLAQSHCDGSPIAAGEMAVRVDGTLAAVQFSTFSAPLDWDNNNDTTIFGAITSQDANFNGIVGDAPFSGFNDWQAVDLRQIGARGGASESSGGGGVAQLSKGGGVLQPNEGGGVPHLSGGGGVPQLSKGGGVAQLSKGGGSSEQDENTANSTADPPNGLTCSVAQNGVPGCVASSPMLFSTQGNSVTLTWSPPVDTQVRKYDIWRATGSFPTQAAVLACIAANSCVFTDIQTLSGSPPGTTFTDSPATNTYTYFVTDTNVLVVRSGPSSPIVVNTAIPLTVTANPASMIYGSTVLPAFSVSYSVIGVTAASLGGTLVCTTTASGSSPVGTYPITCSGQTSVTYNITYVPGTLTVNPAPLTITANNASKNYGATLTFMGTEFATRTLYNADKVTSVTLTSAGAAASATVAAPGPTYSIMPTTAIGTGLGNYTITYANGTLTVNKDNTSTSLMSSLNPSLSGQSVTFTVTVSNTTGTPAVPTGSVQFMDGLSPLGAPQTVSGLGKATVTTSTLTVGTHSITAVYTNSDGNFINSTSASLSQTVEDFSINVTPAAETISSGHQATYTVTLAPINGLTGSVALTCTGEPANSTCALSPSTVSVKGSVTSTVTLSPNKNITHGTSTLTITGTFAGSSLTHRATVQLTVQ
jgi:hypothetical protein